MKSLRSGITIKSKGAHVKQDKCRPNHAAPATDPAQVLKLGAETTMLCLQATGV